jgi:hypothetical protein
MSNTKSMQQCQQIFAWYTAKTATGLDSMTGDKNGLPQPQLWLAQEIQRDSSGGIALKDREYSERSSISFSKFLSTDKRGNVYIDTFDASPKSIVTLHTRETDREKRMERDAERNGVHWYLDKLQYVCFLDRDFSSFSRTASAFLAAMMLLDLASEIPDTRMFPLAYEQVTWDANITLIPLTYIQDVRLTSIQTKVRF